MNKYQFYRLLQLLIFGFLLTLLTQNALAQESEQQKQDEPVKSEEPVEDPLVNTLETLETFVTLKGSLQQDIQELNKQIKSAQTELEKTDLGKQRDKLKEDLSTTTQHMKQIAAGIDISDLEPRQEESFDFQKELFSLLKPAFDEVKEMTSNVRQKSELKENIAFYELRLPIIQQAIDNVSELQQQSKNKNLRKSLIEIKNNWSKQQSLLNSELQANQLQLEAEGYSEQLLNLRVEFESAAESSLNLVIIADFDGQLADLYNRLRRAIQRICVNACTENNWEIPFPQLTLHKV